MRVKERGDSVDDYRREGMLLELLKNDSENKMIIKENRNLEKRTKELLD